MILLLPDTYQNSLFSQYNTAAAFTPVPIMTPNN
jgi:hypothetical protein